MSWTSSRLTRSDRLPPCRPLDRALTLLSAVFAKEKGKPPIPLWHGTGGFAFLRVSISPRFSVVPFCRDSAVVS